MRMNLNPSYTGISPRGYSRRSPGYQNCKDTSENSFSIFEYSPQKFNAMPERVPPVYLSCNGTILEIRILFWESGQETIRNSPRFLHEVRWDSPPGLLVLPTTKFVRLE